MAKIVHSTAAPKEPVHYSFDGVEFDLGGSKRGFESDDPHVLATAEAHPWLKVDRPKEADGVGTFVDHLAPKDDPFTIAGSKVDFNDPKVAEAAELAKAEDDAVPVAIEAGRKQAEAVVVDAVAETVAADPASKTKDKKD